MDFERYEVTPRLFLSFFKLRQRIDHKFP
jgi:hypothetical protein